MTHCATCGSTIMDEPFVCPVPDCLAELCCWECYEPHKTDVHRAGRGE